VWVREENAGEAEDRDKSGRRRVNDGENDGKGKRTCVAFGKE